MSDNNSHHQKALELARVMKVGENIPVVIAKATIAKMKIIPGYDVIKDILFDHVLDIFDKEIVLNHVAKVHEELFSEEEIEEQIKFYSTPVGQKMSDMMPQIFERNDRFIEDVLENSKDKIEDLERQMTERFILMRDISGTENPN